jgi:two-component system, chemotaxis family, protein-glutamate methylesterase/glutaminase
MARSIITIGTSMGGLHALQVLLGGLPKDFPLPVAIVQHRGPDSDESLRDLLAKRSAMPIREVEDKDPISGGTVYLAPPDYHLLVDGVGFALSTEAKVQAARPAIDLLFESASERYGAAVIAVVLTGASQDGARGAAAVKRRGGRLIVQDPETASARFMPESAIKLAKPDHILPLEQIAACLIQIAEDEQRHADHD